MYLQSNLATKHVHAIFLWYVTKFSKPASICHQWQAVKDNGTGMQAVFLQKYWKNSLPSPSLCIFHEQQ